MTILESLSRVAHALDRGGGCSEIEAAASKAVLAAVTAFAVPNLQDLGGAAEMSRLPADLEERVGRIKCSLADVRAMGDAAKAPLQQHAERIEKEVADLRAQVARRLDASAAEVATSRRDAELARMELLALRQDVAKVAAQLDRAERSAQFRAGQGAQHIVQHYDISSAASATAQAATPRPACVPAYGAAHNSRQH